MLPKVPDFDELLDSAMRTAVHLEMHDNYAVDHESGPFADWLRTGVRPMDPDGEYWTSWISLVRRTVARGVAMRRLRVVSEPLSDYTRYEHAGTPVMIGAGEDVRWLPRRAVSDLLLPGNDFWLVDDKLVRFNLFDGDGRIVEPQASDDPVTVERCASAYEAAWARAIPHTEYRPG